MLRLDGRAVLVVGGGPVAVRRAGAMRQAGAEVTVVAPRIDPAIQSLNCRILQREYQREDAADKWLVVAATDDPAVNARIARDAREAGALVNRTDDPQAGDVIVPAHGRVGPITLAVGTDGISAAAGAAIRDQLLEALDEDWAQLLQTVGEYRPRIQQAIADVKQRQILLRRLADEQAMTLFKRAGEPAVRQRCEQLIKENQ